MGEVSITGSTWPQRSVAHGSVGSARRSRGKVLPFPSQPRCVVAMEACASAHYWGREIMALGHEVRLPPIYVKPFVKRQKNDETDAEAIRGGAAADHALRCGEGGGAAGAGDAGCAIF